MADFRALPVDDGVGPYHFNRFRVAFEKPGNIATAALAADFIGNFPLYFKSPVAVVEKGDKSFDGNPTLKFHCPQIKFGVDVAKPHNDWVAQIRVDMARGFTAQTLAREFFVAEEDIPVGVGSGLVGGTVARTIAVDVNRMHFLAGRRAWLLGEGASFGVEGKNVLVLETMAVERFSSLAYVAVDKIGEFEKIIPDIWTHQLNNFVVNKNVKVIPQQMKPHWETRRNVDFVQIDCGDIATLQNNAEFVKALKLYPDILPPAKSNGVKGGGGTFVGGGSGGKW